MRLKHTLTRPVLMGAILTAAGCGAGSMAAARGDGIILATTQSQEEAGKLTRSVFVKPAERENLSEEAIQKVLDAPVEVEFPARAGVVVLDRPFSAGAYAALEPGDKAPQLLAREIEKSNHFRIVSDISPHLADGQSVESLRELAVRYRLKYLVVFNRRFADRSHVNPWGWGWLTVVGIPFVPAYTLETQGLLEATLLDVRTGTFLFTTQVHVKAWRRATPFFSEGKLRDLQQGAARDAVKALSRGFLARCNRVVSQMKQERRARAPEAKKTATAS